MQVIKEKKGVTDQQSCFIENMLKTSGMFGPNMKAQQQNGNKKKKKNRESALNSVATELLIQLRHIVIPFCLVEVGSNRLAQLILLGKFANFEAASMVTRAVREALFITAELSRLLVNQEHISVQTCSFWWTRTDILRQCLSLGDIAAGNVHHKPMMPLSVLWTLPTRCVGVSHAEGVKSAVFCWVRDFRRTLDLRRRQNIPHVNLLSIVSHLNVVLRDRVDHIRNYLV